MHPEQIFVRLDFFLISDTLLQFVKKCDIGYGLKSDHSVVILDIQFELAKRGPGYWKFNNLLLRDPQYLDKINKLIDIELAQNYADRKSTWEMFKLTFRGSTLQYSARRKKSKNNIMQVCAV